MRKYFGTDGIRRIANTELTPELVYKVAKAGAYVLAKHSEHAPTILIGRDTRLSGTLIESAMTAGFLSYGANVKLLGVLPTPGVAYLTKKLKADASVVISASHNTYEFNGIKYFSNKGMKIPDEIEEEIETVLDSGHLDELTAHPSKIGVSEYREDLADEYIYMLRKNFEENIEANLNDNFCVALDVANGATYKVAEKVFTKLGINFKIINNSPSGININENCGSTHLGTLKEYVLQNHMSLGIANEIDGDILLAIFGNYLKEKGKLKNDTIVATIMSNMGLNKFAANNNITLKQTKVGDRYVLEEMLKNNYNLGGEQSGHIIMLDYNPTGDGILTSLMLIQILLEKKVKVSELSKIMKKYPQAQVNVKVCNEKKPLYQEDSEILNEINSIKEKLGDNGRIVVRASGTEPLIRVMLEGESQSDLEKMANKLAKLIKVKLN